MSDAEKRVEDDFKTFIETQQNNQSEFANSFNKNSEKLDNQMNNLEVELNALKSKAYENVSDKIKVFEDDFFADLSKRSNALDESLIQWQQSFNERLGAMTNDFEDSRRDIEIKYSDDLKEKLSAVQDKVRDQTTRLDEMIKSTEANLLDRVGTTELSIRTFVEQQKVEMDNAKNSAESYLKMELDANKITAEEQLKRFERDLNSQLNQIALDISNTQEKTNGSLEVVLSDFSSWRDRMNIPY